MTIRNELLKFNYIAARSAPYYRVSTELAAYKNVEMERAKNDLEEHQLVCVFAPVHKEAWQGPGSLAFRM